MLETRLPTQLALFVLAPLWWMLAHDANTRAHHERRSLVELAADGISDELGLGVHAVLIVMVGTRVNAAPIAVRVRHGAAMLDDKAVKVNDLDCVCLHDVTGDEVHILDHRISKRTPRHCQPNRAAQQEFSAGLGLGKGVGWVAQAALNGVVVR